MFISWPGSPGSFGSAVAGCGVVGWRSGAGQVYKKRQSPSRHHALLRRARNTISPPSRLVLMHRLWDTDTPVFPEQVALHCRSDRRTHTNRRENQNGPPIGADQHRHPGRLLG